MGIIFDEMVGTVDSPPANPPEEPQSRPAPSREPEGDRVRSAICRDRRRTARLEAD